MRWTFVLLLASSFAWADTVQLTVAFGQSRPPYIDEIKSDGISLRLFNAVVEELGWKSKILFVSNLRMQKLLEERQVDIAVEILPNKSSLYYSQPFIAYTNYAFYHKGVELVLNHIDDLQPFSVCAWQNANEHLGIEDWTANKKNYREYPKQKWQVADWLNKRCEVLLIDETLFYWHLELFNARREKSAQHVDTDDFDKVLLPIRQNPLWFHVGFTDVALRDAFDEQLTRLKQSGRYEQILNNY